MEPKDEGVWRECEGRGQELVTDCGKGTPEQEVKVENETRAVGMAEGTSRRRPGT